jgi:hypothetical protein
MKYAPRQRFVFFMLLFEKEDRARHGVVFQRQGGTKERTPKAPATAFEPSKSLTGRVREPPSPARRGLIVD